VDDGGGRAAGVTGDRELARLVAHNVAASLVAVASGAPGARIERLGGVLLVATGLPIRLFNQALVEDDGTPPDRVVAALREAISILRARGDLFALALRACLDDEYLPLAREELGLVPLGESPWMPGMALQPLPAPGIAAPPDGIEIRRVVDEEGVADHVRAAAAGFGRPEPWLRLIVTPSLLEVPGLALYTGYEAGEPVSAGLGLVTGRTVGIYNIATVESARRRGYGAAMTTRIVDDGAASGCDTAILQASEMGKPVYERLGFRTVADYFGYIDPSEGRG
jgi:hypothetical protein